MNLKSIILPLLLTALLAVGCSDANHDEPTLPAPSAVEIQPQALVAASRANLSGAQDGPQFPASTDRVFAVSAFLEDLQTPYFLNQPIRSDADGTYHFHAENGLRYYPEDGTPLYFYAVSPACAEQDPADPKKLTWTLTGQEDIMYAADLTGIAKDPAGSHAQPHPNFNFQHKLVRFNFKLQYTNGYADRLKFNGLQLLNVNSIATLNLETGELEFDPESKAQFTIEKDMLNLTSTTSVYYASVMCGESESVNMVVTATGIEYPEFTVHASSIGENITKFEAGKCYDIILKFSGVDVKVSASLADWSNGGKHSDIINIH